MASNFNFLPLTMGQLLKRGRLKVPSNQRSYAWREKQVRYLVQDLNEAIFDSSLEDYFLGTVVIIEGGDLPSIVDGQQRIATTSILLARIRDQLASLGRDVSASSLETTYLAHHDIHSEQMVSRIRMNEENNDFYNSFILPNAINLKDARQAATRATNRRLLNASVLITEFLTDMLKNWPREKHVEQLLRWEKYIDDKARVLAVYVPDEFSAYRMFETLNDRGLRASQVDILKNYLFSRCEERLDEAKALWTVITTAIEPLGNRNAGDEDDDQEETSKSSDPVINFFRHFWVTLSGPTKGKELAEKIRAEITNEARALRFLTGAAAASTDYVAITRSGDPKWRDYNQSARQNIDTLNQHLRVSQIRPLVFAIAHFFDKAEAEKALKLCVSWSVRFLIAGGRGGMLDLQYSRRANEIGTGKIKKARELRDAMAQYIPTDEEFEQAFAVARISRPWLARYLIRAIEKNRRELPSPEFIENEDVKDVNLEHILPEVPGEEWDVEGDVAEASRNLLGNQALLASSKNVEIANRSFEEKRKVFATSFYKTTQEIAEFSKWTRDEILERQRALAASALKTWTLTF